MQRPELVLHLRPGLAERAPERIGMLLAEDRQIAVIVDHARSPAPSAAAIGNCEARMVATISCRLGGPALARAQGVFDQSFAATRAAISPTPPVGSASNVGARADDIECRQATVRARKYRVMDRGQVRNRQTAGCSDCRQFAAPDFAGRFPCPAACAITRRRDKPKGAKTRERRPGAFSCAKSDISSAASRSRGTSGRSGDVFNPNTGEVQAKVALASKAEVEKAIANAQAAFPAWAATNPQRRARVMFKFLELIQAEYDDLARLLSSEHGKTFADAKGDIQRGLEVVEFACGIPHLLKGEYTEGAGPSIDLYSVRQPLGVVAGITPFNFPAMIPLWKAAPAIACGNTFILKPSERDPSVPIRIAELFIKAGPARGRAQCRQRRQGSGRCAAHRCARQGDRLRRLVRHRAVHLFDRLRARKARAVLRRRQEPHDRDAGRRHRSGGRCADRRRLRLGRRALHGDLGRGAGRQEDRRHSGREADPARREPEGRPFDRHCRPTTARWSPRRTCRRCATMSISA